MTVKAVDNVAKVSVLWVGQKKTRLPNTLRYVTVAKFEEDKDTWDKEAWSIELDFVVSPAQQGNPSRGTARFLMENGPVERLTKGKRFEMYEGKTKVAEIEII